MDMYKILDFSKWHFLDKKGAIRCIFSENPNSKKTSGEKKIVNFFEQNFNIEKKDLGELIFFEIIEIFWQIEKITGGYQNQNGSNHQAPPYAQVNSQQSTSQVHWNNPVATDGNTGSSEATQQGKQS